MKNPQTLRITKAGNTMASTITTNWDGVTHMVEKPMKELHIMANHMNAAFNQAQVDRKNKIARHAELARLDEILAINGTVDSKTAGFLQDGRNIDKDRSQWQATATANAVASKSEFTVYRRALGLHGGNASWTLDKKVAADMAFAYLKDSDKGIQNLYSTTIHVGDEVTFIGNQNGYKQYEVIIDDSNRKSTKIDQ